MIVVLAAFLLVCLFGIKYRRSGNPEFFDQNQTNCIRGVFALIIFMSHFNSYVSDWGWIGDGFYRNLFIYIGQMMVAPFLFISGYGIYLSSQKKKNYIKDFPKKRILKTYLFFALAVLLYLLFNLITSREYSLGDNLLAFIGLKSIGNSNWFMFAILLLYFATYVSALITKKTINRNTILLVFFITILYIITMRIIVGKDTWWYDTAICFPAGMLLASFKNEVSSFFARRRILSIIIPSGVFVALYITNKKLDIDAIFPAIYNLLSCAFCFLIARLSFSFTIGNRIIGFLGAYGFEIYILQRIPHSLLSSCGLKPAPIFFIASLASTIIISILFKSLTSKLSSCIIKEGYNKRLKNREVNNES